MPDDQVAAELRRLNAMFALAFASQLEAAIKAVVRSEKQQAMWSRMDGTMTTKEIAVAVGITPRAVQILVAELTSKGLVSRNDGRPKRTLDLMVKEPEEGAQGAIPAPEAAA